MISTTATRNSWVQWSERSKQSGWQMMHFFGHKNSLFPSNRFSTVFFSLKSNIIWRLQNMKNHLSKLHYRFRRYTSLIKTVELESLCLQFCEGLLDIFRPPGQILKKTIITLQALKFKLSSLKQTCILSKSIRRVFQIVHWVKDIKTRLRAKSSFLSAKCIYS